MVSTVHAQGVALDQYRAAETPLDGFVVTRPRTLGHLRASAGLHPTSRSPLRGSASSSRDARRSRAGGAGRHRAQLLDRIVVAAPSGRALMGPARAAASPPRAIPRRAGGALRSRALGRYRLVGEEDVFALAMVTGGDDPARRGRVERAGPAARPARPSRPSSRPSSAFFRCASRRTSGAPRARSTRRAARAARADVALAVSVDAIPDVLEVMLEGWGRDALRSLRQRRALAGGVVRRARPIAPLFIGPAGGAGSATRTATRTRVVLTAAWPTSKASGRASARERAEAETPAEAEVEGEPAHEAEGGAGARGERSARADGDGARSGRAARARGVMAC